MKKILKYLTILCLALGINNINVQADSQKLYVDLTNLTLSSDNKSYSNIKKYDTLEEFTDNIDNLPDIYITSFLYDGISAVKSPDLDDFIENESNDTKIKTLEITVININTTGDIQLTGKITGAMIAVNTNGINDDINLILNGVNIDTDSKKAPAIFIYNKKTTFTDYKVTIKTVKGTENYIVGGKLKKVSLMASDNLDSYASYYSDSSKENYNTYTSYYGIYTEKEIENILFATVKADSEDLNDGDPLYFYKGSGAISSDIDLYFEGEGYLKVTSKNKEGIETKGNLTFSGGTGDYEIYAYDDCLNTTTSSSIDTNARNDMVIDVNSLIAIVDDEGDEGDAIDSNGKLTVNGGTIYAFSHSTSNDCGLDSEKGTYINGGTIIATGNMADSISSDSMQNYIYVQFNDKISSGSLVAITDKNDNIIFAFESSKDFQTLLYSAEDLDNQEFNIYLLETIDGTKENGVYTEINNYSLKDKLTYTAINNINNFSNTFKEHNISNFLLSSLLVEICLFAVVLIIPLIVHKIKK